MGDLGRRRHQRRLGAMGIVRFALRFPYTFYVVAALILFLGSVASYVMRTDIFPDITNTLYAHWLIILELVVGQQHLLHEVSHQGAGLRRPRALGPA